MSGEPTGPVGARPDDPAWVRLLFLLVQGRDGQCWRAVLLLIPPMLLVATLLVTGLVVVTTATFAGWISGAFGVGGTLTAALALAKRRGKRS